MKIELTDVRLDTARDIVTLQFEVPNVLYVYWAKKGVLFDGIVNGVIQALNDFDEGRKRQLEKKDKGGKQ